MKKILAASLSLAMLLAFASCDPDEGGTSSTTSKAGTSSTTPTSSAAEVSSEQPVSEPEDSEDSLNLAFKGDPYVDSVSTQYTMYTADLLNDGDNSSQSRWQSNAKGNTDGEGNVDPAWCGIVWEEAQTFDMLVIEWESAHPTEDGYTVQISDDGETFTDLEVEAVRTGTFEEDGVTLNQDHQIDTITFDPVTAKYVRIYCFKAYVNASGDVKEHPSCYEFEVYNSADLEAAEGGESQVASDGTVSE